MTMTQPRQSTFEEIVLSDLRLPAEGVPAALARLRSDSAYLAAALSMAAPLPTDGTPYSRKIAHSGPLGEVMIAHWGTQAECYPHDHGEALGVVLVLSGEFVEQSFTLVGSSLRKLDPPRAFRTGDVLPVTAHDIHSLRALREGVTLHFYAPPIRRMKVYDQNRRTIFTVSDNCGAWVPSDESLILARAPLGGHSLHHEVPRGR